MRSRDWYQAQYLWTDMTRKIRKASRYRLTLSNETILATTQEFSVIKVTLVQSIANIVSLSFWLLNVYFILHYHLFFCKNILNDYISVNTVFEWYYMFFDWKRDHQLSTYVTGGWIGGSSKMPSAVYRGRGSHASCVPTYNISFHVFGSIFVL